LGVFEASTENKKYSIGCDGDQATAFAADGKKDVAELMVTSAMKNVDKAILQTVEKYYANTVPWGKGVVLGLSEGDVGIAKNTYYENILTQEQRTKLDDIEKKIISGELKVVSAFDLSNDEVAQIRNSVQP
jgi:basic membrane protein A